MYKSVLDVWRYTVTNGKSDGYSEQERNVPMNKRWLSLRRPGLVGNILPFGGLATEINWILLENKKKWDLLSSSDWECWDLRFQRWSSLKFSQLSHKVLGGTSRQNRPLLELWRTFGWRFFKAKLKYLGLSYYRVIWHGALEWVTQMNNWFCPPWNLKTVSVFLTYQRNPPIQTTQSHRETKINLINCNCHHTTLLRTPHYRNNRSNHKPQPNYFFTLQTHFGITIFGRQCHSRQNYCCRCVLTLKCSKRFITCAQLVRQ